MNNTIGSKPLSVTKILLLVIAYCFSLLGVIITYQSLRNPYLKDVRQGYLIAQAMVHGVNPYLPLPELEKLWLPEQTVTNLPHPTPHPFAVGWLCLPLVLLHYQQVAVVWIILQLSCLVFSIKLLLRVLNSALGIRYALTISFLLLGWRPLMLELWWSQLNLLLLLLFLLAWHALRRGKDNLGGALLGSLLLLKFAGWPIVLWLVLMRRWRAVWLAGVVWVVAHLLAIGLHGWGIVFDYYFKVVPQVNAIYRARELNYSAWTIGQRLFTESGYYIVWSPLWNSQLLAKTVTILAPLTLLILALRTALRVKHFDTAFALLMGIGIVLNPIAWLHYLLLALPALVLLLRRLHGLHWPRQITCVVISLIISLSLTENFYLDLARLFAVGTNISGQALLHTLPALLTMIPLGALCLLLWLLVRLDLQEDQRVAGKNIATYPSLMEPEENVFTAG
jgi:hypothetical protein